jgi:hypothetical protein
MAENTHKLFSSRVKVPPEQFVGDRGRIFYHELTGELRISDGVTPHGHPIFTGSGSGTSDLILYKEHPSLPVIPPAALLAGAIALGDGAAARLPGALTHSAGAFTLSGDAQVGNYVARNITTNSTFTELFLDGVSSQLIIPTNTTMTFTVIVVGRRTDSTNNEGAIFEIRGGVDRAVSTISTALLGRLNHTMVTKDNMQWNLVIDVDTATGALRMRVNGEAGKTIRWVAHIHTVEVRN